MSCGDLQRVAFHAVSEDMNGNFQEAIVYYDNLVQCLSYARNCADPEVVERISLYRSRIRSLFRVSPPLTVGGPAELPTDHASTALLEASARSAASLGVVSVDDLDDDDRPQVGHPLPRPSAGLSELPRALQKKPAHHTPDASAESVKYSAPSAVTFSSLASTAQAIRAMGNEEADSLHWGKAKGHYTNSAAKFLEAARLASGADEERLTKAALEVLKLAEQAAANAGLTGPVGPRRAPAFHASPRTSNPLRSASPPAPSPAESRDASSPSACVHPVSQPHAVPSAKARMNQANCPLRAELLVLDRGAIVGQGTFPLWDSADVHTVLTGTPSQFDIARPQLSAKMIKAGAVWARLSARTPEGPTVGVSVSALSIVQSLVCDCSFVCSVAVASAYEQRWKRRLISSAIYPQNESGDPIVSESGRYAVKMLLNGAVRRVVVDDYVPVHPKSGVPFCAATTDPRELWVSLYEKAFIKVHGNSYEFPGSNSGTDLYALCGWVPEVIKVSSKGSEGTTGETEEQMEKTWQRLLRAQHAGTGLFTAATPEKWDVASVEETLGLVSGHAYAILDVVEFGCSGKRYRLIRMKNPWTYQRWKGKFSHQDAANWPPALADKLDISTYRKEEDKGVFWISWADVVQYFSRIHASWNPSWAPTRTMRHLYWMKGASENSHWGRCPMFHVTVAVSRAGYEKGKDKDYMKLWLLLFAHTTAARLARTSDEKSDPFITLHVVANRPPDSVPQSDADDDGYSPGLWDSQAPLQALCCGSAGRAAGAELHSSVVSEKSCWARRAMLVPNSNRYLIHWGIYRNTPHYFVPDIPLHAGVNDFLVVVSSTSDRVEFPFTLTAYTAANNKGIVLAVHEMSAHIFPDKPSVTSLASWVESTFPVHGGPPPPPPTLRAGAVVGYSGLNHKFPTFRHNPQWLLRIPSGGADVVVKLEAARTDSTAGGKSAKNAALLELSLIQNVPDVVNPAAWKGRVDGPHFSQGAICYLVFGRRGERATVLDTTRPSHFRWPEDVAKRGIRNPRLPEGEYTIVAAQGSVSTLSFAITVESDIGVVEVPFNQTQSVPKVVSICPIPAEGTDMRGAVLCSCWAEKVNEFNLRRNEVGAAATLVAVSSGAVAIWLRVLHGDDDANVDSTQVSRAISVALIDANGQVLRRSSPTHSPGGARIDAFDIHPARGYTVVAIGAKATVGSPLTFRAWSTAPVSLTSRR